MGVQKTDKLVRVVLWRGSGQGDEMFADRQTQLTNRATCKHITLTE